MADIDVTLKPEDISVTHIFHQSIRDLKSYSVSFLRLLHDTLTGDVTNDYRRVDHLKPAIIRDMCRTLTHGSSVADTSAKAEMHVRVIQFLLAADDPVLIYDLRANKGVTKTKPKIHFGLNVNASNVDVYLLQTRHILTFRTVYF